MLRPSPGAEPRGFLRAVSKARLDSGSVGDTFLCSVPVLTLPLT